MDAAYSFIACRYITVTNAQGYGMPLATMECCTDILVENSDFWGCDPVISGSGNQNITMKGVSHHTKIHPFQLTKIAASLRTLCHGHA